MISLDNLRILFLEDNVYQARLTITIIETYLHSKVAHVASLAATLEVLQELEFDIIILDLHVPDAKELEALKAVQARVPDIPIIVLTGRDEEYLAQKAVEFGAQDFIHKSNLDPELLRRSIRYSILRHKAQVELRRLKERELEGIHDSLRHLENISWESDGALTTGSGSDSTPLRERDLESFRRLEKHYRYLLTDFCRRVTEGKSILGMGRTLGTMLVQLDANPNDLNDLHLSVLKRSLDGVPEEERRMLLIDGRMFALEVMGYLAEAYRREHHRQRISRNRPLAAEQTATVG